jgi:hypothetical protein
MKKNIQFTLLLSLLLSVSYNFSNAQCAVFAKKKCLPLLAPFLHNGQNNTVQLSPGETAILQMTFYIDTDYRLAVAGQDNIGKLSYKVMKRDSTIIFDSEKYGNPKFWDFTVNSTQQMLIEVSAQDSNAKLDLEQVGCVSVMVGYKKD